MIKLNRRRFLILAAVSIVIVIGALITFTSRREYIRSLLQTKHNKGVPDSSAFDPGVINTLVAFLGAYFASKIDRSGHDDLARRLQYAVMQDNGWRSEYHWLAGHLDETAQQKFGESFTALSVKEKNEVLTELTGRSVWGRKSKLLAVISSEERQRRVAYNTTIPQLIRLYRHSSVAWKNRGYSSWPGVPGNTFDYTQPGPVQQC